MDNKTPLQSKNGFCARLDTSTTGVVAVSGSSRDGDAVGEPQRRALVLGAPQACRRRLIRSERRVTAHEVAVDAALIRGGRAAAPAAAVTPHAPC